MKDFSADVRITLKFILKEDGERIISFRISSSGALLWIWQQTAWYLKI
jgi:hypothetical protein